MTFKEWIDWNEYVWVVFDWNESGILHIFFFWNSILFHKAIFFCKCVQFASTFIQKPRNRIAFSIFPNFDKNGILSQFLRMVKIINVMHLRKNKNCYSTFFSRRGGGRRIFLFIFFLNLFLFTFLNIHNVTFFWTDIAGIYIQIPRIETALSIFL